MIVYFDSLFLLHTSWQSFFMVFVFCRALRGKIFDEFEAIWWFLIVFFYNLFLVFKVQTVFFDSHFVLPWNREVPCPTGSFDRRLTKALARQGDASVNATSSQIPLSSWSTQSKTIATARKPRRMRSKHLQINTNYAVMFQVINHVSLPQLSQVKYHMLVIQIWFLFL